jgi:hypothetical protein
MIYDYPFSKKTGKDTVLSLICQRERNWNISIFHFAACILKIIIDYYRQFLGHPSNVIHPDFIAEYRDKNKF